MKHLGDITKINGAEIEPVERTYIIYKYTFPDGKIYIGVTSQTLEERRDCGYSHNKSLKVAMKTCGWKKLKKEILKDGLSQRDAFALERKTIAKLDATNPTIGYNISLGGKSTFRGLKHTDEYKQKMSELQKGKVFSEETLRRLRLAHKKDKKPVVCETSDGIITRFESIRDAARHFGGHPSNISRACNGTFKTYKGLVWKYERG